MKLKTIQIPKETRKFDPAFQCKGKKAFGTTRGVINAIKRYSEKHPGIQFKSYKCPHCKKYHVTKVMVI